MTWEARTTIAEATPFKAPKRVSAIPAASGSETTTIGRRSLREDLGDIGLLPAGEGGRSAIGKAGDR